MVYYETFLFMLLAIQILVLVAASLGTLVAFGGETWEKGIEPLWQRVTVRGWLSILLLLISLFLGVAEKTINNRRDTEKELEARRTQAANEIAATKREDELRQKLNEQSSKVGELKAQLPIIQGQLTSATKALAANELTVGSISRLDAQIDNQVDLANKSIGKSNQVLDQVSGLQTQIRNVALVSALAKNQSQLDIEVHVPIRPIVLNAGAVPKTLVDLVFPLWREDGTQEPEELLLGFELESYSRSSGKGINGSLLGFTKDPYKIVTMGSANVGKDPLNEGLETSLKMYGDASIATSGGTPALSCSFRFPSSQVPGQWLSEFRVGTKLFSTIFVIRKDLDKVEKNKLIDFWNKMFLDEATVRIPLLDQDNFYMEYKLKRNSVELSKIGSLSILSVSYVIASSPKFGVTDL